MRREFLKSMAGLVAGSALNAWAADEPRTFAAIGQGALQSAKAAQAAFFDVGRAGRRLVAVGERGIVMLSDDEGQRWRQARAPVSVTLTAVCFADDKNGWATGHLGVVLHTADAGESWTRQLDGLQAAQLAMNAARKAQQAGQADAQQLLSAAQLMQKDGPDKPFFGVYFESATTGLVIGAYNLAFRTQDGGKHWEPWMSHITNPKGLHLYAVQKAASKTGEQSLYVVGEQAILLQWQKPTQRFEPLKTPAKGTFFGLVVGAQGELVAFGLRGKAVWSGDAGASWQLVDTGTTSSLSAGILLRDGRIALGTQTGEVLISADSGRTFAVQPMRAASPLTALLQLNDHSLLAATLRGVHRLGQLKPA